MQLGVSLVVSFETQVGEVWREGASLLLKNSHAPLSKSRIVSLSTESPGAYMLQILLLTLLLSYIPRAVCK